MKILQASKQDNQIIQDAITDYNIHIVSNLPRAVTVKLDLLLKDDSGSVLGGINAEYVNWGILYISLLFIFEQYRGQGYGSRLLHHVEEIAKKNGCYLAHLDTFDFQGKDFYLKQGYEIFGVLENCPMDHSRYYFKKDLRKYREDKVLETRSQSSRVAK